MMGRWRRELSPPAIGFVTTPGGRPLGAKQEQTESLCHFREDVADCHHHPCIMSAVSSVLRIACRNRSCIIQHQKRCRALPHPRQWQKRALGTSAAAPSTAADQHTSTRCVQATTAAVLMACLAATGAAIWHDKQQRVVQNEPRRVPSINNARAANLRQFRSINERGMSQKYTVDWKVVLGEGAYGSVHPARLAATGEKVRKRGYTRFEQGREEK